MKKIVSFIAVAASALAVASCTSSSAPEPVRVTINNDCFWHDTDGNLICSQGGGIFRYEDPRDGQEKFFWYGVHYAEADSFAAAPVRKYARCTFEGVTLYTSHDMASWKREADVLTPSSVGPTYWVGRMGVAHLPELGKYALLIQQNASVLVALSESPLGPFEPYRRIDMTSRIGTPNTGDQTVFVDDDGKAYLIYSLGRGRSTVFLSRIGVEQETDSVGLVDCVQLFKGHSREGNCMFKYDGRYFISASNIYGWDASHAFFLESDSVYGPYRPVKGDMRIMRGCSKDYAHVSQTGFYVTLRGSEAETVIYCGDRWADFANNGLGYNQWVPLAFDPEGEPVFNSMSQWQLVAATGQWCVGPDNNYVANGSFEADRRIVPISKKPDQDFITGWDTEYIQGRQAKVGDPSSPNLNRANSPEDQLHVVGKMSLCISDSVAFERKVTQTVRAMRFVPLPDGDYLLSATVRLTGSFDKAALIAEQEGGIAKVDLRSLADGDWHKVSMEVKVRNGKQLVGFHVKGSPLAMMQADDVALVRKAVD